MCSPDGSAEILLRGDSGTGCIRMTLLTAAITLWNTVYIE